jgi:hypothetical protein
MTRLKTCNTSVILTFVRSLFTLYLVFWTLCPFFYSIQFFLLCFFCHSLLKTLCTFFFFFFFFSLTVLYAPCLPSSLSAARHAYARLRVHISYFGPCLFLIAHAVLAWSNFQLSFFFFACADGSPRHSLGPQVRCKTSCTSGLRQRTHTSRVAWL